MGWDDRAKEWKKSTRVPHESSFVKSQLSTNSVTFMRFSWVAFMLYLEEPAKCWVFYHTLSWINYFLTCRFTNILLVKFIWLLSYSLGFIMARKSNFLIGTRSYCKRAREKYLGNTTPAFLFSHHAIILHGAGTSLRIHGIRVYTYGRTRTFMESLKGGNLHVTRFPAHLSNLIRDFHAMLTQNVSRFSFGLNWRSFCTWSVWSFNRYIPLMPFLIL